jgi:hypothetical protein
MGYNVDQAASLLLHHKEVQGIFLYFLETGTLPRDTRNHSLHSIQEQLLEQVRKSPHFFGAPGAGGAFCHALQRLLLENEAALSRLLSQFGDVLLEELYDHTPECGIVRRWIALLSNSGEIDLKKLKWRVVCQSLAHTGGKISMEAYSKVEKEILLCLLREVSAVQLFRWISHLSTPSLARLMNELDIPNHGGISLEEALFLIHQKTSQPSNILSTGARALPEPVYTASPWEAYIDNAGLILLHAYLPALFRNLDCWDGFRCRQDMQQRIILLIQNLVRPADLFPEYQLLLNKLLCGYHAKAPLPLCLEAYSVMEHQQLTGLLYALQRDWTLNGAPVNPTIESLRESFLQRQGKLIRRESDWLLQVEQKAYDLVLNSLPWNIRMIRLPWMQETLWVEWI